MPFLLSFIVPIGSIPTSLGRMTNLKKLNLLDNLFIGPVPSELGSLTQLAYISVAQNSLIGEFYIE